MTVYELKNKMYASGEYYFFDAETLKFFGERMSDMKVLKDKAKVTDICGEDHECYILSVVRRKRNFSSCRPYRYYHYIDTNNFHPVIA